MAVIKEEPRKKNDVRKRGGDKTAEKDNQKAMKSNKQQKDSAVEKKIDGKKNENRQRNKRWDQSQTWKKKENQTESNADSKNYNYDEFSQGKMKWSYNRLSKFGFGLSKETFKELMRLPNFNRTVVEGKTVAQMWFNG